MCEDHLEIHEVEDANDASLILATTNLKSIYIT